MQLQQKEKRCKFSSIILILNIYIFKGPRLFIHFKFLSFALFFSLFIDSTAAQSRSETVIVHLYSQHNFKIFFQRGVCVPIINNPVPIFLIFYGLSEALKGSQGGT